jgi:nicotinate-nucleotide adenylyltransferase
MNLAIFGGSFDPPHLGHEQIIKKALETLDIEKLLVVPTFLNPFKKDFFLTPQKRLKLMNILCKDLKKVEICDYEIRQNKAVQTIETIKYIKSNFKNYKTIYLIIGADNLKEFHLWDRYEEIIKLVKVVVVTRDDIKFDGFLTLKINSPISSTKLRKNLNLDLIPTKIQPQISTFF